MKLGVLLRGPSASDLTTVRALAEVGYDGFEIALNDQFEHRGALGARARVCRDEARIAMSSVCVGWLINPESPLYGALARSDLTERALKLVSEIVAWCEKLGGSTVLLPFFGKADLRDARARVCAVESLRRFGRELDRVNVRIGVEGTLPANEMAAFLDEIGQPKIGCYWDAGNATCLGYDPATEIRTLGSRIVAVQVKEFLPDAAWKPAQPGLPSQVALTNEFRCLNVVPLGEGKLALGAILRTLQDIGYDGWVSLELFPSRLPDVSKAALDALPVLREARTNAARVE